MAFCRIARGRAFLCGKEETNVRRHSSIRRFLSRMLIPF